MRIACLLFLVLPLAQPSFADGTFTTSTGAVFTQVSLPTFGNGWKDPSGMIWSGYQGEFENNAITPDQDSLIVNSAATQACAKIAGRLPTADEFNNLATYFEHGENAQQGRRDLAVIFPRTTDLPWYWTASAMPFYDPNEAALFNAYMINATGYVEVRTKVISVLCISK